jgi:hypothetical protein
MKNFRNTVETFTFWSQRTKQECKVYSPRHTTQISPRRSLLPQSSTVSRYKPKHIFVYILIRPSLRQSSRNLKMLNIKCRPLLLNITQIGHQCGKCRQKRIYARKYYCAYQPTSFSFLKRKVSAAGSVVLSRVKGVELQDWLFLMRPTK